MNVVKGRIRPLRNKILASDMNFEEQKTASGIIIKSDDGKVHGVRPRWCRVWAVGPEQKEIEVGKWIYVEHGRWTRGIKIQTENGAEITVRGIDNNAILLQADEPPSDIHIGQEYDSAPSNTVKPEDFMT